MRSRATEGPYNSFMRPDVPILLFDVEDWVEISGVERPAYVGSSGGITTWSQMENLSSVLLITLPGIR